MVLMLFLFSAISVFLSMISFLNSLCSESSQTHNPSFFLNTDKIYKRYIKHYRNIQYELTVNINYNTFIFV